MTLFEVFVAWYEGDTKLWDVVVLECGTTDEAVELARKELGVEAAYTFIVGAN